MKVNRRWIEDKSLLDLSIIGKEVRDSWQLTQPRPRHRKSQLVHSYLVPEAVEVEASNFVFACPGSENSLVLLAAASFDVFASILAKNSSGFFLNKFEMNLIYVYHITYKDQVLDKVI